MKRLWNPGYSGNPWMPSTLYNDITQYGNPSPPPGSTAMITEGGILMVTEITSSPMITE
jgi:hypothetical protein